MYHNPDLEKNDGEKVKKLEAKYVIFLIIYLQDKFDLIATIHFSINNCYQKSYFGC